MSEIVKRRYYDILETVTWVLLCTSIRLSQEIMRIRLKSGVSQIREADVNGYAVITRENPLLPPQFRSRWE
jgi:hypothetical protein